MVTPFLSGQESRVEVFDHRDGLQVNGILDMDQDRYDRMLLCTGSGPLLFDGVTFSPLFEHGSMIAMEALSDANGDLLLSMADGTTQRWNGRETILLDVPAGTRYIADGDDSGTQIVTDRHVFQQRAGHLDTIHTSANGRLIQQAIEVRGELFLIENSGLSEVRRDGRSLSHEYPAPRMSVIGGYERGKIILLVTQRHGIFGFDPLRERNPFFRLDEDHPIDGTVLDCDMDANGDFILLMDDGQLLSFDFDTRLPVILTPDHAVSHIAKSRVLIDRFHNVWIATRSHGLLLRRHTAITQLTEDLPSVEISTDMAVSGDLLLHASDKGVRFYRQTPGREEWLIQSEFDQSGVVCATAYAGEIYLGLSDHLGVRTIDVEGNVRALSGLENIKTVQSIAADDDRLILGTVANGLVVYSIAEERVIRQFETGSGLGSNDVEKVFVDSEGTIWALTNPLGVQYIFGDDIGGVGLSSQLVPEKVTNVVEDRYGNIYLSIYGKGLFQIEDDELLHIDLGSELSNEIAYLASDWDGNLWMACHDTFLRLGLPSLVVDSFPAPLMGLNSELNGMGMKRSSDNELYFITERGVSRLDRRFESIGESRADLRFDLARLNGKEVSIASLSDLDHGDYSLELFFSTCCLHGPERIRYEYRVDGENDGIPIRTENGRAYMNHLGVGDHLIQIRATDCEGNWNDEWLPLKVSIASPFYSRSWFVLSMIVLLGSIVGLGFRLRTRAIRQQNERLIEKVDSRTRELTMRTDELRHMNQEMNSSIDYAINIQRAMLPAERLMKQDLEHLHLYYSPKEQLSGDFYWASSVGDNRIVVCGDCTGHGVPGALVSMLCMSELDKAVNGEGLLDPAEILQQVDERLVEMLHSNDEFHAHDGMAVSLCVIDKGGGRLHFAGAGQHMYYQTADGLKEARGCRDHVGGAIGGLKAFETISFDLTDVHRVFLFTDGLCDQFGGERSKKFMKRRIRESLSSQMEKDMITQCRLLTEAFEEWKNGQEQTDDVLFIGIEA